MAGISTLPPTKFTETYVHKATRPEGAHRQVVVRDTEVKGLLLVLSGDAKSYAVQRHIKLAPGLKQTVRKTLGRADDERHPDYLKLAQARDKAKELLLDIGRGIDPRRETQVRGQPTLQDAWDFHVAYLEEKVKQGKASTLTVNEYKGIMQRHFSNWAGIPIRTFGLNPHLLEDKQKEILKGINKGRRKDDQSTCGASAPLKKFGAVYARYRKKKTKLALPPNPVDSLDLPDYQPRKDHLPVEQLKVWWKKAHELTNDVRRDYHLLCFFSGMRPGVASAARTEHFDAAKGVLYFPRMKSGREFYLPLSDFMVGMLKRRVRENGEGEEWLFPADRECASGHLEEFDDDALRMKGDKNKVHCWTGHWLRHNFASHALAAGVPKAEVSKLLDHSEGGVTGRYIDDAVMLGYMRRRQQMVTDHLMAAVQPKPARHKR
jgi:integrase